MGATHLTHHEARARFLDLADAALSPPEAEAVHSHLRACRDCAAGWQAYAATVQAVRTLPREAAPPSLASDVLARVQRRRQGQRGLALAHARLRVPAEMALPLLLAAAVAALLLLLA